MIVGVLTAIATSIGLAQAVALLDQTRKLRRAGSAREVSVSFLAASLTGNVIWLAYGLLRIDPALLIVNCAGLLGASAALATALRLRRRCPAATTAVGTQAEPDLASATGLASMTVLETATGLATATGTQSGPRPHPNGAAPTTPQVPTAPSRSVLHPRLAPPRVEHIQLSPAVGRHRRLAMLN